MKKINETKENEKLIIEQHTDVISFKKQESKRNYLPIIILALSLIIIFFIASIFIFEKNKNISTEDEKYYVKIYEDEKGTFSIEKKDGYDKVALSIEVENENANIIDYYTNKNGEINYVLYNDPKLEIYDIKNKKNIETNLNYDEYQLQMSYDGNQAYGIIYNNMNKVTTSEGSTEKKYYNYGYYNLDTKERLYENKYISLQALSGDFIVGTLYLETIENEEGHKTHLLNISEEKIELTTIGFCNKFTETKKFNNKYYYIESNNCPGEGDYTIYTNSKQKLIENKQENEWGIDSEGNLYVTNNNKIEKYNIDGKLLETSKMYTKVLDYIEDYRVYVESDNQIYIENNAGKTKLGEWKEEYYYHHSLSRYADEKYLTDEPEKNEGIYIVIGLSGYDEGTGIEYYFNPKTNEVKVYELERIIVPAYN